jgi:hypothetical protein
LNTYDTEAIFSVLNLVNVRMIDSWVTTECCFNE